MISRFTIWFKKRRAANARTVLKAAITDAYSMGVISQEQAIQAIALCKLEDA